VRTLGAKRPSKSPPKSYRWYARYRKPLPRAGFSRPTFYITYLSGGDDRYRRSEGHVVIGRVRHRLGRPFLSFVPSEILLHHFGERRACFCERRECIDRSWRVDHFGTIPHFVRSLAFAQPRHMFREENSNLRLDRAPSGSVPRRVTDISIKQPARRASSGFIDRGVRGRCRSSYPDAGISARTIRSPRRIGPVAATHVVLQVGEKF
jgi:hypothetical protein